MRSALDDAAFVHDQDLVRLENRGEAVRDDDGSAAAEGNFKSFLDRGLRFGIQVRGCLLTEHKLRDYQPCPQLDTSLLARL